MLFCYRHFHRFCWLESFEERDVWEEATARPSIVYDIYWQIATTPSYGDYTSCILLLLFMMSVDFKV